MKQLRAVAGASMLLIGSMATASAQSIYTCVDASGRKITSDRPIATCADRDQKELNPSGTVKRVVKPTMTVEEQRAQEARLKAQAEEQARQLEEKRKNRALLARYPNKDAHDRERGLALTQVDEVTKAATKRLTELAEQRKKTDTEMEFYKSNPAKAPAFLKRQYEENDKAVAVQKRFIGQQEDEKKRVNARFDEELTRLRGLWAIASPSAAQAPASPANTKP
jgi:hypothetical protein